MENLIRMADVHSKAVRSYNMSKIKGKNTKPELIVRKHLHALGFRYRIHDKKLPGTPDIVLPKYKTVIQVHGCFWHGHKNCKYFILPKTRTEWWTEKINRTIERDKKNRAELLNLGLNILSIYECQLKPDNKAQTLFKLVETLKKTEIKNR